MAKQSTLSITTTDAGVQMNIIGSKKDMLFNWTAITSQVIQELGMPPVVLAASLPQMVAEYERVYLKEVTRVAVPMGSEEGSDTQ